MHENQGKYCLKLCDDGHERHTHSVPEQPKSMSHIYCFKCVLPLLYSTPPDYFQLIFFTTPSHSLAKLTVQFTNIPNIAIDSVSCDRRTRREDRMKEECMRIMINSHY